MYDVDATAKAGGKAKTKPAQVCMSSSEDEMDTDAEESDFDVGKEVSDDDEEELAELNSEASGDENVSPSNAAVNPLLFHDTLYEWLLCP